MTEEEIYRDDRADERMSTKDFLIGALVGGIVGATTALLLAPKSGKDLRQDINEQSHLIKEKTSTFKDTAIDKGSEFVAAAKEKTASLSQTVQEQSANIMNKIKSEKDAALDDLELTEEEIEQKLSEAKLSFDETEANLEN